MHAHDVILHNANVITLDGGRPRASAIALRNGMISAVGESAELLRDRDRSTRTLDVAGSTVLPGFYDAHPHMDREGLKSRGGISIDGLLSIAQILEVVREAAARTPPGEWIVLMPLGTSPTGFVSRPEQMKDGRFPTRHDLDAAAPEHPVYIRAVWGWWSHRPFPSIANSRALALAGVNRDSVAPYNTEILRDDAGEPTGVFLDRSYAPVLEYTLLRCVPRFTYEDRVAGVRLGAQAYAAAGTTAAFEGHGITPALIHAYREVDARGELPVRLFAPLSVPSASFDNRKLAGVLHHWADTLQGVGSRSSMFRCGGICIDVGDAQTAALIGQDYPYEQWAGHFYQSVPHDRFVEIGVLAARLGLRVSCLVCYDLERVLRAYEAIDAQVSIAGQRWVIIHVIEATAAQLRRIKALGLIATVTPNFMYMAHDRFSLDRLRERGIPIRELLDAGIPVALSSDNVPFSMLWTMWESLARYDADSDTQLGPANLTREEALVAAVSTGHQLTWDEDIRGTLAPGKSADLVVLGGDPLTCELADLKDVPVERTFVGGKEMFVATDRRKNS